MKLLFLGTAAAEGYPGIFCSCAFCNEARALGGRSIRLRSALQINDDLLIDFGPDLLAAAQKLNLNLWNVRTGLVTHTHMDHFFLGNFEMRQKPFTGGLGVPTLRLFGSPDVAAELAKIPEGLEEMGLDFQTVRAFESWQERGYIFTAYRAHHAITHLEALFYGISDSRHAVLYATDTGDFPVDTWQALEGKSFDVIVLEETLGAGEYDQHLGFESFLRVVKRIRACGMLRAGGRIIAHHFSHSGNPTHDKLVEIFRPHAVEVAYDGMAIILED